SALTGTWLSATTLGLVADGAQAEPDFPASTAGGRRLPALDLPALAATDLADLRELVFPGATDPGAVYTLRTTRGDGYVDPATGMLLAFRAHSRTYRAHELLYRIHTGEGLWWLGLLLGLSALGAPWLAATGTTVWWQRQRARPRIAGNSSPESADTVLLVGSENNSTWGFARVLHEGLRRAGQRVHTAPMNTFSARHRSARRLFILTATYGDGDAPASASQFLALSAQVAPNPATAFAVLGFGDRQFPKFCQFAKDVDAAMRVQGWLPLLALATINRQSTQAFAHWGTTLGERLQIPLVLEHTPLHPRTMKLQLRERIDYGEQEAEPTVVLRFTASADARKGWFDRLSARRGLPRFEAGDLVGVVAPGSPMPRFYSLASGARDGVLEICVRRQSGGLCSTYLHALKPGDSIDAFIQANPQFRPASGRAPVILIGAGTGIGPLAGFIRNNSGRYPMYLYWGGRDPASDFLYEPELRNYLADRRLTQLHTAFSRVAGGVRVQARLTEDADNLRTLIGAGAQVLVCGSGAMARRVRLALDEVLAPIAQDVNSLKAEGRYREDVF
ncbi:MAG: flavodoxin domain-containing protein, partial [Burkholderiales bacterium]|nr:flavodoxin domain-containing protein [Burkholderiales bacterium]